MISLTRRDAVSGAIVGALTIQPLGTTIARAQSTPLADEPVDQLVIDLPSEPGTVHPAKAYADIEWGIVHSVFDAVIGYDADGNLKPIGAETFELINDTTWKVTLHAGRTFHDGSAVTAEAVRRGVDLVQSSDSYVADVFSVITDVEIVDDLTAHIVVSEPSPWLPSQMAPWLVLVPEELDPDHPNGSGPYRFEAWERGNEIRLTRNESYAPAIAKGRAIAERVTYHFVPDATTRSSNLLSGASDIATFMPIDTVSALAASNLDIVRSEIAGSSWIRIATDVAPFDDVRVRRALNLALNLESFAGTLVSEGSKRLASILPGPLSAGFDPELEPYAYNVEEARKLLEEAGVESLQTTIEVTTDASVPVCEAIVAMWAEVGINAEIVVTDLATFNASWTDPNGAPLRMASWSPLFDPSMLLQLVFQGGGILSRYDNEALNSALLSASTEMDVETRADLFRQAAEIMHEDAACVFLWNLINVAGVSGNAAKWTPRPDQWPLALAR